MDSITYATAEMWKSVICPTETGIYLASVSGEPKFYVIVEDSCDNDIQIKWLGTDGFYRFGTFINYTSEKWQSKEGVSVDVFNDSLSTAVAVSSVISKDNQKTLTLRKINVPTDIYLIYMDLVKSPKVYLNMGDGFNDRWVEVSVKWSPVYDSKKNFHQITIDVELQPDFIQSL